MAKKKLTKRGLKKLTIGVLMGGPSAESEISLKTGKSVLSALKRKGYRAVEIIAGDDLCSLIKKKRIDVAFIALHGPFGEDGTVQGMLEVMGIPYTGSGVLSSALCMDKVKAKEVLHYLGILTPPFRVLTSCSGSPGRGLSLPYVVKPPTQGSAIGTSIVKKKSEFEGAIKLARKFDDSVLVESFIEGREVTVGVIDGRVLPIVEIRPRDGFYDFKAKYTKGESLFIVPAKLGARLTKRVERVALDTYTALKCRGAARVDIIISKDGSPYVLEVNTIPGMTELSLLPLAAEKAGITYDALVEVMALSARKDN